MQDDRKRKLRRREEKHARQDERRRASFERLLNFLGLKGVFDRFPPHLSETFLRKIDPGIEVIAAEDSGDDPAVQRGPRDQVPDQASFEIRRAGARV